MKVILFFIVLLLTVEGCISPSTITTANITQPVLVGKVKNIEGKPIDKKNMYRSNKFSASITNSFFYYFLIYYAVWGRKIEGSNTFDKQLLPIIDAVPNDSTTIIMVDGIDFNTTSVDYLFYISTGNYGWIYGAKYK